ncbi:hypothetical protein EP30_09210 [Bifidobacterium sp. UTCIF-39]|uniref:precorrin-2 dehydrogenase/sirohydrochlorin ferrochelatase family protein n=1 Tax=Bifidobacterium sp. UTCIF-39 TaxID=1465359 RepID=UPI00112B74BC|nr:NAD(P)-dependent oxidoreductase [Bifidobacterium sp. UTCIF-39]TPF96127.1 hypothetical protein EP30_09210 [Bifidobacterium sp. UTCIF-39]
MTAEFRQPYPVNLDIRGRRAVVVGGGTVAARKVMSLLHSGAHVTVISPTIDPRIAEQVSAGRVIWVDMSYKSGDNFTTDDDAGRAFIMIACTDDPTVNAQAANDARAAGVPLINNAADPAQSTFANVAVTEHDGLMLTVSTYGQNPSRARRVKALLHDWLQRLPA